MWEAHKPTYKMLTSEMGSSEKLKLAKITDYTAFTLSRILTFLDLKFLLSTNFRTKVNKILMLHIKKLPATQKTWL